MSLVNHERNNRKQQRTIVRSDCAKYSTLRNTFHRNLSIVSRLFIPSVKSCHCWLLQCEFSEYKYCTLNPLNGWWMLNINSLQWNPQTMKNDYAILCFLALKHFARFSYCWAEHKQIEAFDDCLDYMAFGGWSWIHSLRVW